MMSTRTDDTPLASPAVPDKSTVSLFTTVAEDRLTVGAVLSTTTEPLLTAETLPTLSVARTWMA